MKNLEETLKAPTNIVLDDAQVPNDSVSELRPYGPRDYPVIEDLRVSVPPPAAQRQQEPYVPDYY